MFEALGLVDSHKATGIDSIEPRILKIVQLVSLYACICTSPLEWCIHCIILIFKSGDKSTLSL